MLGGPLEGPGTNMRRTEQPVPPLARSVAKEVLDWDHVEPREAEKGTDLLGLSAADRQALGMSAPRPADLQPASLGGAEHALSEVLARGTLPPGKTTGGFVPAGAHPKRRKN